MSGKEEKNKKEFADFLAENHALIVDKSGSSRRRLIKTLNDLGGKTNQISAVSSFEEAKEIIDSW